MPALDQINLASSVPGMLASTQAPSGEGTVYTVPASKAAKVLKMVLANTSAAAVTVAVSVVPSGGSAGPANRVVAPYLLAAGDSTVISEVEGMELGQGDFISVNASAATSVAVTVNGRVYS